MRVRIKRKPLRQARNGVNVGLDNYFQGKMQKDPGINQFGKPEFQVNRSISETDEEPNIEAEGGEFLTMPGSGGIPENATVRGPRHAQGGVDLNVKPGTFVFSDHKMGMKIKDKELLASLGMSVPKKGRNKGYTPAQIAKKYDINPYLKIVLDPDSDKLQRETAEEMIKKYVQMQGKIALVQESMKGFPQGVPEIAMPYLQTVGVDPNQIVPQEQMAQQGGMPQMRSGGYFGDGVTRKGVGQYQQGGFEPHIMIDPQTGREFTANTYEDHLSMQKMGYTHPKAQQGRQYPGGAVRNSEMNSRFPGLSIENNVSSSGKKLASPNNQLKSGGQTQLKKKVRVYRGGNINAFNDGYGSLKFRDGGSLQKFIPMAQQGEEITEDFFNTWSKRYKQAAKDAWKAELERTGLSRRNLSLEEFIQEQQEANPELVKSWRTFADQGGVDQTTTAPGIRLAPDTQVRQGNQDITFTFGQGAGGGTGGGGTYTSTRTTKEQNIPEDANIVDDPSKGAKGDYYRDASGKYYKITRSRTELPEYKGTDVDKVFAGNQDVANRYQYLEDTFKDPEVAEAFATKTREALKNQEYYKRKEGASSKYGFMTDDEIDNLSTEEIVSNHLEMQKRNYSIGANGIDLNDFEDSNGKLKKGVDPNKYGGIGSLDEFFGSIDMPSGKGGSEKKIGIQQASYFGYRDLIGDENLDPALREKIQYFEAPQIGVGDEGQTGDTQISPIDMWYTNTTAGELDALKDMGAQYEEVPWEDVVYEEEMPAGEIGKLATPKPAPWWAQDIGNIGNLFGQWAGIKKYLPIHEGVKLQRPDVLYHDPTRALAANAEMANIASQYAKGFAGPQATYRMSDIFGQGLEGAANILADYENRNVGIGNQYYNMANQIANQEAMANAQARAKLHAGWTIANQQYDNAKREAQRNLFEGWRQGLTNRWQTQTMNELYPQYFVNPAVGGSFNFWEGRPFVDEQSAQQAGTMPGGSQYLQNLEQLRGIYGDKFTDQEYQDAAKMMTSAPTMPNVGGSPYPNANPFFQQYMNQTGQYMG